MMLRLSQRIHGHMGGTWVSPSRPRVVEAISICSLDGPRLSVLPEDR